MITAFKETIVYPFRDPNWGAKLWPMPLLAFVPALNLVAFEGWRMLVIKRMAVGESPVPDFDLFAKLAEGMTLIICRFIYTFVPLLILNLLGAGGIIGGIQDLFLMASGDREAFFDDQVNDWVTRIIVIAAWYVISAPIFHCGMIRYALSGNWQALLNIPANVGMLLRNFHHFLLFYLFAILAMVLIALLDAALVATVAGALLVPVVTLCLYYAMAAHELGELAHRIAQRRAAREERRRLRREQRGQKTIDG